MRFNIRLDEKLGNLNKLPAGYKKLVQYVLKNFTRLGLGASENSNVEIVENVMGDKITRSLNKAIDNQSSQLSFFIISNDDGYKIYAPYFRGDDASVKKSSEFMVFIQEMPSQWDMNFGPSQPTFRFRELGNNRPLKLREVINFDDTKTHSLYIVFKDPSVSSTRAERHISSQIDDPMLSSTSARLAQARIKKQSRPIYEFSLEEIVTAVRERGTLNTKERGKVRLGYEPGLNYIKSVDGVVIGYGTDEQNKYVHIVLTLIGVKILDGVRK